MSERRWLLRVSHGISTGGHNYEPSCSSQGCMDGGDQPTETQLKCEYTHLVHNKTNVHSNAFEFN